jgi:hypothetical protein
MPEIIIEPTGEMIAEGARIIDAEHGDFFSEVSAALDPDLYDGQGSFDAIAVARKAYIAMRRLELASDSSVVRVIPSAEGAASQDDLKS